jgi:uncharacterized protein YacL
LTKNCVARLSGIIPYLERVSVFYSFLRKIKQLNKKIKRKRMKNLGLSLLAIVLGLLVSLLGAKVILSVSTLFGLTFLANLGYLKIYGLVSVIHLINYKKKVDTLDGEDIDKTLENIYSAVWDKLKITLVFWGVSYIMYELISALGW